MKNLDRLRGAITASVLVAGSAAYAQEAEPTLTPPPQSPACEPQTQAGECPPKTAPEAQTTEETTEVTPQGTTETTTTTTVQTAPPPPPPDVYSVEQQPQMWYDQAGFALSLGGGASSFFSGTYADDTNIGGSWDLRATIGTRFPVAFEGSYFGSAQGVDALGLDNDAILVGNGLQAAARVNVLYDFGVQPFLYSGVAWRHYDLTNEGINTSDIDDSDDVLEVPLGVGIAGYISGFVADVRAEYRGAWFEDLIPAASDGDAIIGPADRWQVFGTIGVAF